MISVTMLNNETRLLSVENVSSKQKNTMFTNYSLNRYDFRFRPLRTSFKRRNTNSSKKWTCNCYTSLIIF